ncbi:MAG TPA: bifunctional 2-polyprenyl-6-hydroxyphenol methylase/3-demethylubiquinol 3-O-methyltransferase UbiG [Burkholderiales bacterium]|nr:bifunctional 2-polyprenyl-6-hydroxyphenol methylase/3-demethylubiquinol 3-O-methyltransferase UbiG [Burkholderiales bacterium]
MSTEASTLPGADPANVDPQEVAKFSELAHRWWDPASEFRPLHEINPLRLGWIRQKANLTGKAVLDVGCGGGILAEALAGLGARVKGIDLSDKALRVARLHALESGAQVNYQAISAEALAEREPGGYDAITCMEMLEHVPEPESSVRACAALVRPGGHVFFSTINRNPKAYVQAVIGAEYVLGLLPKGTHDYQRFIRPSELASWCRRAGLEVRSLTGMTYNPLTRVYSLVPDTGVNYLLHAQRAS